LTHNDRSVLENHSASVASKLISDCFTLSLDNQITISARQLMLSCILKTDYSKLHKFLAKINARELDWNEQASKTLALGLLVIMGDLSFALRPWTVGEYWYGLMRDEQLQQGDMERRLGMPVAALMDRKQSRPQATLIKTHFKVIVSPVFQTAVKIFPELEQVLMPILDRNLQIVEAMEAVEGAVSPTAGPPPSEPRPNS
jgi:hypothetical protein